MTNYILNLSAANIKYLLVLYQLNRKKCGVRCTDVALMLHVSKPSVHAMMNTLKEMELICKNQYGMVYFTENGEYLAAKYNQCFESICKYFSQLLPNAGNVKSAACALLSELSIEDIEHMCSKMNGINSA